MESDAVSDVRARAWFLHAEFDVAVHTGLQTPIPVKYFQNKYENKPIPVFHISIHTLKESTSSHTQCQGLCPLYGSEASCL